MIHYNEAPRSMRMALEYYCRTQNGNDYLLYCIDNNVKVSEMINFASTREGNVWWFDECARIEAILSAYCVN